MDANKKRRIETIRTAREHAANVAKQEDLSTEATALLLAVYDEHIAVLEG